MAEITFILVGVGCGEDLKEDFVISMFCFGIDFKSVHQYTTFVNQYTSAHNF